MKMKRIISFVVATGMISSQIFTAYADYIEHDKVFDNELPIIENCESSEDILADRFIIKYKDEKKEESAHFKADKAYAKAKKQTNDLHKNVVSDNDIEILSDINSNDTQIQAIDWQSNAKIVILPEEVESDIFIDEMLAENEGIEYIQPDYQLLLSSGKDIKELDEMSEMSNPETDAQRQIVDTESDVFVMPTDTLVDVSEPELKSGEEEPILKKIALIDGGVDVTHEAFNGRLQNAWDFVNDAELIYNSEFSDQYYHGTHVAGIIAGNAPDAIIMPLKVFDGGRAYTSDIIKAIEYAEENGASVVNCSWGSYDNNLALKEAMQESDMLFVCAAGNNRCNLTQAPVYPACFELDNIISVTSVNTDSGLSYYSNYGNTDIAAVGRDVYSTIPNNQYGNMSGTSMAAGAVTGAAGLIDGEAPLIKQKLLNMSDKIEHLRDYVENGRMLNIQNLLNNIISEEYIEKDYTDDFNVWGYDKTPAENWELFSAAANIQTAAESNFTLVLKADGTVWGWGDNTYGQLGDGTFQQSIAPKQIIGLSGITAIDAGPKQAFALKNDGTVYAWGDNTYGQLGDGTRTTRQVPVQVSALSSVSKISAGRIHTAAITENGSLYVWGNNNRGQLGTGHSVCYTPFLLNSVTGVSDVAAGGSHTVAVKDDGTVYAWGYNEYGQLGDGTKIWRSRPMQITDLTGVSKVDANMDHTIAVKDDGTVYAWGNNTNGQLGNGSKTLSTIPIQINNLTSIVDVSAGSGHMAAISEDQTVYMWGNNSYGQLGDGTTIDKYTPVCIAVLTNVNDVSIGETHTAAISSNGNVYVWGSNAQLQLAIDNKTSPVPIGIEGLTNPNIIKSGVYHNLALCDDKTVKSWGYNSHGQLGDGTKINRDKPINVMGLTDVKAIAAGHYHSLAVKEDGTVYAWGFNAYGQLGDGSLSSHLTPVMVSGLTNVKEVAAGAYYSLALLEDGTVYSWGRNETGQLGDGTRTDRSVPMQVPGLSDVKAIAVGYYTSFALKEDGSVMAWGANTGFQLGDGTGALRESPVAVNISNVKEIAAGLYHTMALLENGTVATWGHNNHGQLAHSQTSNVGIPIVIEGLTDVQHIAAGDYHCMALKADGSVVTWGANTAGQLGNGTYTDSRIPVTVQNLTNVGGITAGYGHSIALKTDGTASAWGNNGSGQLGNGNRLFRAVPYLVGGAINTQQGTGSTITVTGIYNDEINLMTAVKNAASLENLMFKMTYDETKLEIIDLNALSYNKITGTGQSGNVEILANQPGQVQFRVVNLPDNKGKLWSGVLNLFKLRVIDVNGCNTEVQLNFQ